MNDNRVQLNRSLSQTDNLPAIIDNDRVVSYREYHRAVTSQATYLLSQAIGHGDRVAILAENSLEYIVTLAALSRLGAVAVPISPRFPSDTVSAVLKQTNCTTLITDQNHSPTSPAAKQLPLAYPDKMPADSVTRADINPDQDATIVLTSGTSAQPKAALHTLANHYYNALGSNENIPLVPGDRWLLSLPLYHVGGLGILHRCFIAGATVVIAPSESLAPAIVHHKITHLSMVPTQLRRLLAGPTGRQAAQQLKAVLVGGGPISKDLIDLCLKHELRLHTTYGSTEMTSQITTTRPADTEKLYSSGKLLKYREMKIASDGEILVRGKTLFRGYVTADGLERPFDKDGWFATGDIGRLDPEGYLTVIGRKDNMFISGGENIYPEEIEEALLQTGGVDESVVVSVTDQEFGQRPVAFVRMAELSNVKLEDLASILTERLPKFKIPIRFYEWPTTITDGIKPDRRYLQSLAQDLTLGR